MTLDEMVTQVRYMVNRGNTLDAQLLPAIRKAVRWTERNHSLSYMHRLVTFRVVFQDGEVRFLPMPPGCKSFEFIRFRLADGTYWHLRKYHPQEIGYDTHRVLPDGFWTDGNKRIVLESVPEGFLDGQMGYWRYTDLDALQPTDTHWLFDHADDVIEARSMLNLLPVMGANEMRPAYEANLNEALRTLVGADEVFKEGPTGSAKMNYAG